MKKVIIVGFGGHAKSVADSIRRQGIYEISGYTDSEDKNNELAYLGTDDCIEEIFKSGITNAVIGVGFLGKGNIRERIYEKLKKIGFSFPVVVDPSAIVSEDTVINEGTFVGKKSVINSGSVIGKMCIINTASIIEHDCVVDDYTHIAVGAVLCGGVSVGKRTLIGANSTIIQCRTVEDNSIIPAGIVIR